MANFCDKEYYEIDGVAAEAGGGGGAGVCVTCVTAGGGAGAASWSGTPREIMMGGGNGVASVIMLTFPSEPCPHAHFSK